MDLTPTIAAKSDQLDADDLLAGERTFTITGVRAGSAEQPVQIDLAEWPRPWRPSKTMRRLLVIAWGADGQQYVGRRVTLFRNPDVKYGGIAVGGVQIRALSHIDRPVKAALTATRQKKQEYTVQPLPDAPQPAGSDISQITDIDRLRSLWIGASPDVQEQINQRVAELRAHVEPLPDPDDGGDPSVA